MTVINYKNDEWGKIIEIKETIKNVYDKDIIRTYKINYKCD